MDIQFIGTGSAFCDKKYNWNSSAIITHNNKHLLFDCGVDTRHALSDVNKSYKDIDAVYISHLHADHIGGLEWLAISTYFDPECKKPILYCEDRHVKRLWDESLKGGLSTISNKLDDFFDVQYLYPYREFVWNEINMNITKCKHISSDFENVYSYGLMIKTPNNKKIWITSDIIFDSSLKWYDEADIIYHDCETGYKSGVHSHYDDLKTLPIYIKNKIRLYHFQDNVIIDNMINNSKDNDFFCFVERGVIHSYA